MAHYKLIRLSAILLAAGNVAVTILTLDVHPSGGDTLAGTFANAAASHAWTAIHLGQFTSWTALLAGLIVLVVALGVPESAARWVGMFGAGVDRTDPPAGGTPDGTVRCGLHGAELAGRHDRLHPGDDRAVGYRLRRAAHPRGMAVPHRPASMPTRTPADDHQMTYRS